MLRSSPVQRPLSVPMDCMPHRASNSVGIQCLRIDPCSQPMETPTVIDYRKSMAGYLRNSHQMIEQVLSSADFVEGFPHIFGRPTHDDPEVFVRNSCGLLLRKAQLHVAAALMANKTNNVHSLAVHMRVVLECAAQVVATANAAYEGTPKAVARSVNRVERDFQDAMANLSRGQITPAEIQNMIASARPGTGGTGSKPPKRVTLADKLAALPHGVSWYDHLSERFCRDNPSALKAPSFRGGVLYINPAADDLAFASFLDYLAEQVITMLFGYGFLLIAVTAEHQPFDDALQLLERKRSSTTVFRDSRPGDK